VQDEVWYSVPNRERRKERQGKNGEISFCFISLSSLFSTAVCGPKGRRERGGARSEGRRKNSLIKF